MKIQRRLLIIILLLLISVGTISILMSRNMSTNIIRSQIINNLINTAQHRAGHIETLLDLEKEATKQLSESVVIRELLSSTKEEEDYSLKFDKVMLRLKNTVQVAEYYNSIFVLDTKGTIIASSYKEEIDKDESNDPYFLRGKEGVFIKDVYIFPHQQEKTIAFSAPILDEDNKLLGVVVFRMSLEPLFKITTDPTGLGQTGEVFLVNQEGYMITPSRFIDDVILKQKINLRDIEEVNPTESPDTLGEVDIIIKDYRGVKVLSVYTHIPEMNWYLFSQIDVKEVFAPVTQLTITLLLLFAIILLVVIFISGFISSKLTRPIRRLHEGTEEITRGNLNYKVGTTSTDEVGQLSRSFDQMTVRLKKSREELEEYSKSLENKVIQRTEELQKANLKLQEADRLKSIFIASMSHELKTPLTLIISCTGIMLEKISGEINQEQKKQLTMAKNHASHLLDLINDAININKIEAGIVDLTIEEFDLSALSQEIKDAFSIIADKKELELSLEAPPTLLIESDSRRTKQILVNLLSNALKFTDRGEIKIKIATKDQTVEIAVRDSGIGIKREDRDKLFIAFGQIPHPGRIEEGTGLGLYISKKNANLLGGDIMLESELGKGSVFTLILPLKYKEDKV